MKLGKLAARRDSRTLKLAQYLAPALPPIPAAVNWGAKVGAWPMYGNDTLGDCVCAAAGHNVQLWTADAATEVTLPDADVIQMYEQVGGYVPGDPSTDGGCDMLSACKWLRQVGIGGRTIGAFVSVPLNNPAMFRAAIYLFGAVYLGVALPASAEGQSEWIYPGNTHGRHAPGSWGGHCIPVVAYGATGYTVVTWGATMYMDAPFLAAYADEAYALLSPDWINKAGVSPAAFNLSQLQADLALL